MKKIQFLLIALFVIPPLGRAWVGCFAQALEKDSVKVSFLNGINVNIEAVGLGQRLLSDHGQYEVGVRVNLLDRFFPAFEVGLGDASQKDTDNPSLSCKVRAPYFRAGMDYNILRNKHDKYKLFVGARYALSSFKYDLNGTSGLKATYHWAEAVFGLDAKIWGPLHMGWDLRWRKSLSRSHSDAGMPWYVPGFGNQKTEYKNDYKGSRFTLLYHIGLSF